MIVRDFFMEAGMQKLKKFYDKVCEIEVFIAVSCLSISVFALFTATILRVIGRPIRWGLDVALLLFTWSIFLGIDIAFRKKSLVRVDFFINKFPSKLKKITELIIYALIITAIVFMVYNGTKLAIISRARVFNGLPNLSYSWVTASIPVSMLLMLITALRQVYEMLFSKPENKE
jgi:TRAP-type C4-dicarboxylate transport system permease small subunit